MPYILLVLTASLTVAIQLQAEIVCDLAKENCKEIKNWKSNSLCEKWNPSFEQKFCPAH